MNAAWPWLTVRMRPDLVVAHDRHVDEEAEDAGADEVPEPDRHQEEEGPAVPERGRALAAREPVEVPRIEREQRERHDLERGERGAERHGELGLAGEVPVVRGADQPAAEVEDGVEIDHADRGDAPDQAELEQDDRDDHRHEELEEALDPEMDDPEPPHVDDRVVGLRAEEERGQVEERDGEGRDQEEDDERPQLGVRARGRDRAAHQPEPEEQTRREQDLPEAADLQVFPALVADPEPQLAEADS